MKVGQVVGALLLLRDEGRGKGIRRWEVRCLLCNRTHWRLHETLQNAVDMDQFSTCENCRPLTVAARAAGRAKVAALVAQLPKDPQPAPRPGRACYYRACGQRVGEGALQRGRAVYCGPACQAAEDERRADAERARRGAA